MQRVKWLIIIIVKMERTITITVPDADEIKMYTNEELGGQLKGMYMNWLKGIKNEGKLNLFGKVAVFKGKEFENTIFNMFKDCFKGYNYKQVSSVNHYGDGILESPSGLKVMVELKNYGSVVPTSQVDKLKSDMVLREHKYAMFISLNGVCGKKAFDIETYWNCGKAYVIVYITANSKYGVEIGVEMLEQIYLIEEKGSLAKSVCEDLGLLVNVSNDLEKLRNSYDVMEKGIRSQLDNYYKEFRESEISIKQTIERIMGNVGNHICMHECDVGVDEIINSWSKGACNIMNKIYDMIKGNNYGLSSISGVIHVVDKVSGGYVCHVEPKGAGINIVFNEMNISVNNNNYDIVIKYIEPLLKQIRLSSCETF
jgi:HJR/Mrr/RecB family endonuclease